MGHRVTHGNFRAHDHGPAPVTALANDYPPGHLTGEHDHPYAQLLYAVRGVMLVATEAGHWVVPPTRGMWMPPRTRHAVRMIGSVNMRSAFIDPRSEEHTSELQSLMRISYAVFCLKKKN